MSAGIVNIDFDRHSGYKVPFRLEKLVDEVWTPVNISAWLFDGQVRKHKEASGEPLLDLTPYISFLTDGTDGTIVIEIPMAVIEACNWSKAVYDIRHTKPGEEPLRYLEGAVTIDGGVTR